MTLSGTSLIVAALTALFLALYYLSVRAKQKARAAQRDSELRALRILNGAGDAIIAVNQAGNIQSFNDASVLMFGCPAKEAIGQCIPRFLPALTQLPPAHSLARDRIGVRADESTFPADLVVNEVKLGAKRTFMIYAREISERKLTEAALRNDRNFSAAVLDTADVLIVVLNREGHIVRFNRASEKATDYTFDEVKGRPPWEFFASPEEFDLLREATLATIKGELPAHAENVWRSRDGSTRHIAWRHAVLELDDLDHVLCVGVDVTERRALESQLVQARKMEAVGRLAGGVAHDFNNLLAAITGYSDLILRSIRDSDPIRRDVEEIKRAGDRATSLTRQLLAFSRNQVLAKKVVDLNGIVSNTGRMLDILLGAGIEVKLVLDTELKTILADPGQLDQIIVNLALNSRDAMPDGGTLTIETSNVILDPSKMRTDPVLGPGDYVILRVLDTGAGMAQETIPHIFEPFFTTKDPGMGTGLGLATVYGIVRQCNGAIGVTSESGKGSCFTIFFPLAGATAFEGAETILIVESEEEVRTMMARVLERSGYHVIEARSGVEAIDRSLNRDCPIHLTIGDPELFKNIVDGKAGMRALYLERPVNFAALPRKVREALDAPPERSVSATAGN